MQTIKRVKYSIAAVAMAITGAPAFIMPAQAASASISYGYPSVYSGVAYSTACLSADPPSPKAEYYVRMRRIGTDGSVTYGTASYVSYYTPCASLSVSGMRAGDKIQGYNQILGVYRTLRQI